MAKTATYLYQLFDK